MPTDSLGVDMIDVSTMWKKTSKSQSGSIIYICTWSDMNSENKTDTACVV